MKRRKRMKTRKAKKAKKCQVSGYSCSGILFEVSHRSHGMCAAMQRTTCDQDEIKWFQMLAYALQVLRFVVLRVWWAQIQFFAELHLRPQRIFSKKQTFGAGPYGCGFGLAERKHIPWNITHFVCGVIQQLSHLLAESE